MESDVEKRAADRPAEPGGRRAEDFRGCNPKYKQASENGELPKRQTSAFSRNTFHPA